MQHVRAAVAVPAVAVVLQAEEEQHLTVVLGELVQLVGQQDIRRAPKLGFDVACEVVVYC